MESRGTSKYKFKPLTGHTALAVNGVPAEFAAQCMFILNKYQISAAWRVADHSEPERPSTEKKRLTIDIASYPKPSDVKEKSSNWGFTQWFIADDPLLGKYDDESKPVNVGVKRSARVEPTQHFVSLRFILSGLSKNPPTMRLDDITDSNELIITCLDAPAGAPSVHRIQLNRGARPATVDAASLQVLPDSARSKPEWWPAKYHFADLLDQRFPVEYMPTNDKEFQPVRVLGIRDTATQEIIPIITDMDLLWVTEPGEDNPMIQQCNERDVPVFTVMNCYRESEKAQLLDAIKKLIAIDNELYNDDPEMLDNLDLTLVTDDVFSRMGCITPFTAYFLLLTNQRFGLFAEHLEDLMQHGPEIFNPNKPSVLGATLNITGGEIVQTFCEEDQISYALQLIESDYHLTLHPQWNMAKWGVVVQNILEKGERIREEVLHAYRQHQNELDRASSSPVPTVLRRFSRTLSETAATLFRRKSSSDINRRTRKDSTGIFILQIRCPSINIHDDNSSLLGRQKQQAIRSFCEHENQQHNNDFKQEWGILDSNTLSLNTKDRDGPENVYVFKIDAMKISLVIGDVDENSLKALKQLSDTLFNEHKVEIIAANKGINDMAEKTFTVTKSPRAP